MIGLAIFCTLVGGALGAFLEPTSFAVSVPIAIMGGFIMNELRIILREIKKTDCKSKEE